MDEWLYALPLLPVLGIVIYLIRRRGGAVSKSIIAILCEFQPGNTVDRAALDSCTGWIEHPGRFRESGTYEFLLAARMSSGDVEVVLLDKERQQLLRLNPYFPVGRINLDSKDRYYLRWEFRNATGKCELQW